MIWHTSMLTQVTKARIVRLSKGTAVVVIVANKKIILGIEIRRQIWFEC